MGPGGERVPAEAAEAAEEVETPLLGGDVTEGVVRVGSTVRRPRQPQSEAVSAYLRHLERVGFSGSPRWHGVDDQGRDVLDFIEGEVPAAPPEPWSVPDPVLVDVARLLRRLHEASASFVPPPDARWFGQDITVDLPAELARLFHPPELVSHMDVTPQNVVFQNGRPAALIDFDMSRPTIRLLDVVNTAMWWVPLMPPADRAPSQATVDVPARLNRFVDAYGLDPAGRAAFLDLAIRGARRSWHLMRANAEQRGGGWARMWAEGVGDRIRRRQQWLAAEREILAAALR